MRSARLSTSLPVRAVVLTLLLLGPTGCASDDSGRPGQTSSAAPDPSPSRSPAGALPSVATRGFEPTDADFATFKKQLAIRSRAVQTHDLAAFLSVVDDTDPDFVEQERRLFDNLTALPLASYSIETVKIYLQPADVEGTTTVLSPRVVEHVRIEGVDTRPAGYEVRLTWAKRDRGWLIAAESSAHDDRLVSGAVFEVRPWFGDPLVVRSKGGTVVALDAGEEARADELLAAIRDGIEADAEVLGLDPRYDVLVDATANGGVDRMNPVDAAEAGAVTFTAFTMRDFPGLRARPAGARIKLNPDYLSALIGDEQILRHELTHYLTQDIPVSPRWLVEGLAEYVSHQPHSPGAWPFPSDAWQSIQDSAATGPPISDLFGMSPTADYAVSWCAVSYLVERGGMARLLAFMNDFTSSAASPRGDASVARLLKKHYGLTRRDLVRGTRDQAAQFEHL